MILCASSNYYYSDFNFYNNKENIETHRALFTNFLTPVLTREFCNPLDDWLESTSPTNNPADYKIRVLTSESKNW